MGEIEITLRYQFQVYKVTLKTIFVLNRMEDKQDPEVWFTHMDNFRWTFETSHQYKITDEDFLIQVISNNSK